MTIKRTETPRRNEKKKRRDNNVENAGAANWAKAANKRRRCAFEETRVTVRNRLLQE